MRGNALWVGVLLALATAVGAGLWLHVRPASLLPASGDAPTVDPAGHPGTAISSPPPRADRTADAPGGIRTGSGAATPLDAAALPPIDAPLSSTVGQLRERIRAGDARAACRLAAEIERCERVGEALARTAEQARIADETAARMTDEATRERVRQANGRAFSGMAEQALAESRHCEGVVLESPRERVEYWRQAAAAGHRAAMRQYAVGNAFQWRSLVETADLLPRYRTEAEALARRAAAAGDGVVLLALINAYSPVQREMSMNFLAQSTAADAVETAALIRFALSAMAPGEPAGGADVVGLLDRRLEEVAPTLDAAQQAEADRRFSRYLAEWMRPQVPSKAELQTLAWGGVPSIARESCAEPLLSDAQR